MTLIFPQRVTGINFLELKFNWPRMTCMQWPVFRMTYHTCMGFTVWPIQYGVFLTIWFIWWSTHFSDTRNHMTMKFHYFLDHFLRKTLDPSIPIPILQPYGNERFTFSSALVKKGWKGLRMNKLFNGENRAVPQMQ